ncbi:MAG: hypothetical protein RL551_663, partial [Pseudomonadota bacterium]
TLSNIYGHRQAAALSHDDLAFNFGAYQLLAPIGALDSNYLRGCKSIKQRNTFVEPRRY